MRHDREQFWADVIIVTVFRIHSFIHQWLYSPLVGPGLFIIFVILFTQTVKHTRSLKVAVQGPELLAHHSYIHTQTVGLLGRVISPSQDRYVHTGQHKHRINANTDMHSLNGLRTYGPSVRASEGSSCLRPCGHCDGPSGFITMNYSTKWTSLSTTQGRFCSMGSLSKLVTESGIGWCSGYVV
jgi:hypothetical protein